MGSVIFLNERVAIKAPKFSDQFKALYAKEFKAIHSEVNDKIEEYSSKATEKAQQSLAEDGLDIGCDSCNQDLKVVQLLIKGLLERSEGLTTDRTILLDALQLDLELWEDKL